MAVECPVCEEIVADGTHLAHHLAVMGALDRPAHVAWLDEHAPGWAAAGPADLAPIAEEHARTVDVETPETVPLDRADHRQQAAPADSSLEAILEEARRLTEQRRDEDTE